MSDFKLQASSLALQNAQRNKLIETKRETAMEFERIFAQHLVQELTKGTFKGDDNLAFGGSAMKMYRNNITETLANELAQQRKLGMADMLMDHWGLNEKPTSAKQPDGTFNLKPNRSND
jgi:Rod binding domain-containing protein